MREGGNGSRPMYERGTPVVHQPLAGTGVTIIVSDLSKDEDPVPGYCWQLFGLTVDAPELPIYGVEMELVPAQERARLVFGALTQRVPSQAALRCVAIDCNAEVEDTDEEPELCWHCGGVLCSTCFGLRGHCGAPEIAVATQAAAAGQRV